MNLQPERDTRPLEGSGNILTSYRNRFALSEALESLLEAPTQAAIGDSGPARVYQSPGLTVGEAIANFGGLDKVNALSEPLVGRLGSIAKYYGEEGFLGQQLPALVFLKTKDGTTPILMRLQEDGLVKADLAVDDTILPEKSWVIVAEQKH